MQQRAPRSGVCPGARKDIVGAHKQVSKSGNPQKPLHPTHEIKARLTPRPDNPNKMQTTLIVRRSQSPPPPVDWKTYTANSNRTYSLSSNSPEGADKNAVYRTPPGHPDIKRSFAFRGNDRPSTPSRRQLFMEDGQTNQQYHPSHDRNDFSSSSTVSHCTGSEDANSYSSDVFMENQRGKREVGKSPAPGTKEFLVKDIHQTHTHNAYLKAQTVTDTNNIQRESRPKTPSRFLRPPSPSKYLLYNQQSKISEYQSKNTLDTSTRSSTPTRHLSTRCSSPSKEPNTRSSSPTKQLSMRATSPTKQLNIRTSSPTKQFSQPIKQEYNGVKPLSTFNRPSTPSRAYHDDSEHRGRSRSMGNDLNTPHNRVTPTRSVLDHSVQSKNIRTGRSTPTMQLNRNGMATKGNSFAMKTQYKHASSLEASILSDNFEAGYRYTPLPIGPDQEQELYQSLEDEILSNIKVLEGDSDENSNRENKCNNFTASIASDVAVHDFDMKRKSVSALSSVRNMLKTPDGEVEVPRSGVYINTKWQAGGGSYDDVITELAKGPVKLNRVDVENWISKIPPKAGIGVDRKEKDLSLQPVELQQNSKTPPEIPNHRNQISSVESTSNKMLLPSQRLRQQAMETKKKTLQTTDDNHDQQEDPREQSKLPQSSKPKRGLKKPERVPSIYKLKLKPKIRPRKDNRPEKKPSKIPTPVSYRQSKRKRKKNATQPSSVRSRKESQSTAGSTEDLDTDEGTWSSELSLSLGNSNLQKKETNNTGTEENEEHEVNGGKEEVGEEVDNEEEETWV